MPVAVEDFMVSHSFKNDFYMNDYISGLDSIKEVLVLFRKVFQVLSAGGIMLQKWCSNNTTDRQYITQVSNELHFLLDLGQQSTARSLGLKRAWCPEKDHLKFSISTKEVVNTQTKRNLLASLNSFFDPLGF